MNNEKVHKLYSSPDIIRQMKTRRMRWAGHVARMGEESKCTGFWWESPKKRNTCKTKAQMDGIRMDLREIGWGV
jgi:hypothetical protein